MRHQDAVLRLCEIPGVRQDALLQMIAELGPAAMAFETAEQMASWMGVCPGREESAGKSNRNRSPKGNRTMRRVLNQVAWSAVRTKDSFFRELYHRLIRGWKYTKQYGLSRIALPKLCGKYCTRKCATSNGARWHWTPRR